MAMINLQITSLSIVSITIILAAYILSVALTEFGNSRIAQGQANNITSSSLTPEQKQQPLVGSSLQRLFSKRVVEQDIVDFANFFERCHIDSGSDGNGDGSSSSNTSNSTN